MDDRQRSLPKLDNPTRSRRLGSRHNGKDWCDIKQVCTQTLNFVKRWKLVFKDHMLEAEEQSALRSRSLVEKGPLVPVGLGH